MPAIADVRGTIDVGILAIHAEEIDAVVERLPDWGGTARGTRDYDLRHFGDNGMAALVRGWSGDRPDPARAASALIDDLAPAWLIVIGLASGAPADEPSLGDVLVATSVLDHGAEAVLEDGSHAFAALPTHPEAEAVAASITTHDFGPWSTVEAVTRATPALDLSLKNLYGTKKTKADLQAILRRREATGPRPPRVLSGALLASAAPLNEADLIRAWQRAPRRFRAIETETASVYALAHARGVPVLAVRGIADLIGAHRRPVWAEYARHTAASFVSALLRSGALAKRPHAKLPSEPPPKSTRTADTLTEAAQKARLGDAALDRGDLDEAAARYAEALPLFRAIGDVRGEASGALRFGEIALRRGDVDGARQRYQEALPLFRRVQDALGEANCVARLGDLALRRGDVDDARHRYQDALPLYRRAGDVLGEANCTLRLGDLAQKRTDDAEARARFEEALALYAQIPEPYSMGLTHKKLARVAPDDRLRRRHIETARDLWARAGRHDLVAKLDAELGR